MNGQGVKILKWPKAQITAKSISRYAVVQHSCSLMMISFFGGRCHILNPHLPVFGIKSKSTDPEIVLPSDFT